jgi:hypothetical protein
MVQVAKTREKGKIAHGEWPKIVSRYSNGETIASIGRGYGCTAPAIRYIIKRSGMLKGEAGGDRPSARSKAVSRSRTSGPSNTSDTTTATTWLLADGAQSVASFQKHTAGGDVFGAEVRKRVSADLATFLVALDHVVAGGSLENLASLRDATDCLMRSIARTRMEVERLLSSRDAAAAD